METHEPLPPVLNQFSRQIVHAAFKVHEELGPGLLESVYQVCLAHEMAKSGLAFAQQRPVPVIYDGIKLEAGLRPDFIVESSVVLELKAAETLHPVFDAQLLTYMKLLNLRLGLLINFNVPVLKDGIRRMIR